jgi:hypothetical protein
VEKPMETSRAEGGDVARMRDFPQETVAGLLSKYGLRLEIVAAGKDIPGSYWGESEAGLIGRRILARADTPLHSVLHETCHYICMDRSRRDAVDTDAGGDYAEENAVCYLQVLLADHIGGFDRQRMFSDMDRWGYTFRLGSARAWFENDADDALDWLMTRELIDHLQRPRWQIRMEQP